MRKTIYRKLKDYIYDSKDGIVWTIFGDLMSLENEYNYTNEKGEWVKWTCRGVYAGEQDFLLNYYVAGIHADYKIDNYNTIIPYLRITLYKDKELIGIRKYDDERKAI